MENKDIDDNQPVDVDNLISGDLQPPKNRLHTILTIIALFIIVLMSTIIATKIILDDSQNDDKVLQDPDTIRDPELIKDETKKKDNQTIKPETKSIYDIANYEDTTIDSIDSEEATSIMDVGESNSVKKSNDETTKSSDDPQEESKKEPKEDVNTQPKEEIKPKEEAKTHSVPTSSNGKYYIQVGSFVEVPGKRFLNIIKANGFRYIIRQSGSNKKLLIGGYSSRSQAAKALIDIKDKINKNAFITR